MKTQRMIFGAAAITSALFLGAPNHAAAPADNTQPPTATATAEPSFVSGVTEVVKLFKGGVPTDIILNYISGSTLTFYLNADNIIFLQQQGVPKEVLTALLKRQGETQRPLAMAAQQSPASIPAPQSPAPAYYSAPPENPADNFNNALQARAAQSYAYVQPAPTYPAYYSSYYDSYPYYPYSYSYAYWPPVYFGVGFGHFGGGFDHGGFGGHGFTGHAGGGFTGGHAGGGFSGGHAGGHR